MKLDMKKSDKFLSDFFIEELVSKSKFRLEYEIPKLYKLCFLTVLIKLLIIFRISKFSIGITNMESDFDPQDDINSEENKEEVGVEEEIIKN